MDKASPLKSIGKMFNGLGPDEKTALLEITELFGNNEEVWRIKILIQLKKTESSSLILATKVEALNKLRKYLIELAIKN